ncbi:MAG TPA: hypothetical protein VM511_11415 [Luteolibacter sp.]|nr:hypothetical protein [Luteolibacter sp.]
MKKPAILGVSLVFSVLPILAAAEDFRVFRSAAGQEIKARFEGMAGDLVKLRREDGKIFELGKDKLSATDQAYIAEAAAKAGGESKAVNDAAGHAIVTSEPFSTRKAEELASGLDLDAESQSKYGKSWRRYAARGAAYQLFGAVPNSVALYSDDKGAVTSVSAVYANKGDTGSKAGFGADHFKGGTEATEKGLADAMAKDEETVSKALTTALGQPKVQRFGEGKSRRTIQRWDWNGHSFLLSNVEGEYVGLMIVSTETADAGGKSLRMKDEDLKKRLVDSVVKEPNGDVHISQIPMVDQGPKGYCVPATFERAMRTMGMDADMYLLAMVGQTGIGGGTVVEYLVDGIRSQVYSKGRRTKDESVKDLKIRDVKRYIDQGVPIMWRMCSMDAYNEQADKFTQKRKSVTDWTAYAAEVEATAEDFSKREKPSDNYHVCMIIGYNEKTNELAVSDSWGARFELRWVPVPVAAWASNGGFFMILP